MIKKIFFCLGISLLSFNVFSQENTSSPYSYYGIGEVRFKGTEAAKTMGGLAITGDSIAVNLNNPASYSSLRLTTFSVGGSTNFTKLNAMEQQEKAKSTAFDYIVVGVPMGKFGAVAGLAPYSAIGYKIENNSTIDDLQKVKRFNGSGNINRFFTGFSYQINEEFSVGAGVDYNFGKIENNVVESIAGIQLSTKETNTAEVRGVSFNFGAMYSKKIDGDRKIFSSLTYVPEATLSSKNTRSIGTVAYSLSGSEVPIGTPINVDIADSDLKIPSKLGLGFGIGKVNKWLIGTEVSFLGNKNLVRRFDDGLNYEYKNGQRYIVGGYYIPKYDSFSSYFSRVVYRSGFRFENTGLEINGKQINDYGMNFGFGLPVGLSKIDIGFEFGQRGTTLKGLVFENYFNINIGLSLSDKWFKKTLID
ncbi:MAG: hypothetical protein KYX68_05945 [Flavobacterium sp.]|nr:hypothetical protein [Flavobacterium sp.]